MACRLARNCALPLKQSGGHDLTIFGLIKCDSCPATFEDGSFVYVRNVAERLGWTRTWRGKDSCPSCSSVRLAGLLLLHGAS